MTNYTIHINKAGKSIAVDFSKLPSHVQAHIIEYGLKQKFNDVHSAEKDGNTAFAMATNLLERLQAGELTKARVAGSPVERELHDMLVVVARAKTGGKVVDLKAMEIPELISAIAKKLGKPEEQLLKHFTSKAEATIAKRAAEKASLLSDINLD